MDLFPTLNTIYATFFGTSPPTRACVAVDLSPPTRVKLDCFACAGTDRTQRTALHVQGLSYWAPANIGPYSQAVLIDEQMSISGQIGLAPADLSLPSPQDPATETALVFQHTERVAEAVRKSSGQWKGHTQLAIYWLVDRGQALGVAAACGLFKMVGAIFPTSLDRFHPPLGNAHANSIVGDILPTKGRHDRKAGGHTHRTLRRQRRRGYRGSRHRGAHVSDRQVAGPQWWTALTRPQLRCRTRTVHCTTRSPPWKVRMISVRSSAFLVQVHSRPFALHADAEISLASRLGLERYCWLANLVGNATSIRLFHLRSIEASKGKQSHLECCEVAQSRSSQP